MALKGQPIAVGTTDTTVYTCPATLEGSVHGLVFSNVTGSAATITIKMYIQSTGVTTTVATGISVAANSTYTWPKPVDVNAGDIIKASASTGSAIVCVYSAYENAATPAATGFTPRGAWSSGASYVKNDTVSYTNGNSYVAIQASTNQQPDTQTAYWQLLAERGASGAGDVTGPASSVANEIVLFDGSTGKLIKSATTTGIVKATSGVISAATAGTDYVAPGGALGTPSSGTLTNCTSVPVNQATGTLPVANGGTGLTSGTSGGVPYYSATGTIASSAALAASSLVVGGGAGVAPATTTTGTGVVTAIGNATNGASGLAVLGGSGFLAVAQGGTATGTAGIGAFNNITGYTASGATGTTSTNLVFSTSPTLVTPVLGAATATSINGLTITSSTGTLTVTNGKTASFSNSITFAGADSTTMTFPSASSSIGYLNIPQVTKTGAYTPTDTSDVGKHISITTGGVTVNASIYSAGDVFTIYNNSGSNQTITAGSNVTFRLGGTATTGNRTLAQYGTATLLCVTGGSTPTFVVSGAGVT